MKRLFKRTFKSDLLAAKRTAKEALMFTCEAVPSMTEDQIVDLRLVFNELLVNAVIHGNRYDQKKTVSIEIKIEDGCIHARVSDEGMGFDYQKMVARWNLEGNLLDDHGRGVLLAYHITDGLKFRDKGKVIEFTKRLVGQ